MKKCSTCKIEQFFSEFYKAPDRGGGIRSNCKTCCKKYHKTHIIEDAIRNKKYRQIHKEEIRKYAQIHGKIKNQKLKNTIFDHYGTCQCCGENNRYFLTIDHANNDGAEHRRKNRQSGGCNFYRWIIRNNFPKDLQSYCYNCNLAKAASGLGFCPHKIKKTFFS